MSLRAWVGASRLLLGGTYFLGLSIVVAAQDATTTTPPIRLSTPSLPEAPPAPEPPRGSSPTPSKLHIPDVDTEYRPAAEKQKANGPQAPKPEESPAPPKQPTNTLQAPIPDEPPAPAKVVTTSWQQEEASPKPPPPSSTVSKTETVGVRYVTQKQTNQTPPGNAAPSGPGTASPMPSTTLPAEPPPTQPAVPLPPGATVVAPTPGPNTPPQFQLPFIPANFDWQRLTDFYGRIDGLVDREVGFPERQGIGFEIDARLRLPDTPFFSLIGEFRYDAIRDYGDRITWTFGGVFEEDLLQIVFGVDGINDMESHSYVGSGFIMVAQDLPSWHSRIGIWSNVQLWDDFKTTLYLGDPFAQIVKTGVKPVEQTSIFYSARLGPNCRWGEAYVAPGVEHDHGHFRLSLGYQTTIVGDLDAYVHFTRTFDGNDDWAIFAGLQLHFGCGSNRPFDFVMPLPIRAREQQEGHTTFVMRNLLP